MCAEANTYAVYGPTFSCKKAARWEADHFLSWKYYMQESISKFSSNVIWMESLPLYVPLDIMH